MKNLIKLFSLLIGSVIVTQSAWAIPPPEFIISGLQSVMQIAGVVVAFFISIFFLTKDFLKNAWTLHREKFMGGFLFLAIIITLIIGTVIYKYNV